MTRLHSKEGGNHLEQESNKTEDNGRHWWKATSCSEWTKPRWKVKGEMPLNKATRQSSSNFTDDLGSWIGHMTWQTTKAHNESQSFWSINKKSKCPNNPYLTYLQHLFAIISSHNQPPLKFWQLLITLQQKLCPNSVALSKDQITEWYQAVQYSCIYHQMKFQRKQFTSFWKHSKFKESFPKIS